MARSSLLHRLPSFRSTALPCPTGGLAIVTGATSGIGLATITALAELSRRGDQQFTVIGTSRRPERISDPVPDVTYLPLDLGDPESIAAFSDSLAQFDQTPAVLVNNAGESQSGPCEELPAAAMERLFAVNVLGPIDLTQRVLPAMRRAGRGRVIMVGSMLASFPLAYRSSYVASKAALKGFAFSARREVRQFSVGISVVEPGSINTGISERRTNYIDDASPYRRDFTTMLRHLNRNEAAGIAAETVAESIVTAIMSPRPRPLYAVGSNAQLAFPAARLLPLETMHGLVNRKHGLS